LFYSISVVQIVQFVKDLDENACHLLACRQQQNVIHRSRALVSYALLHGTGAKLFLMLLFLQIAFCHQAKKIAVFTHEIKSLAAQISRKLQFLRPGTRLCRLEKHASLWITSFAAKFLQS
jgi:hypothetical protein